MPVHSNGRKFCIESNVAVRTAVEEFAVNDQAGLWEDGADRERLAPTRMRDDDIWNKSGRCQVRQRVKHLFGAMALQVETAGKGMRRRHIDISQCVFEQPDILDWS